MVLKNQEDSFGLTQKVLIADDNKPTRELFKKYFQKASERNELECEILEAHNGAEALKLLEITQPDLIICDVNMPEMDGFKLFETYLQKKKSRPFSAFAFISSSPEERKKAFKLGACGFATKQEIDYFTFTLQIKSWLRLAYLERKLAGFY